MEIILVVEHRTSGGRAYPHVSGSGKLVEVIQDGCKRKPKTNDVKVAINWLMKNGYEPTWFQWIDKAGFLRRRKQTYRKETVMQNATVNSRLDCVPNGQAHVYTVMDHDSRYTVATQLHDSGCKCHCKDFRARGGPCLHIMVAELTEAKLEKRPKSTTDVMEEIAKGQKRNAESWNLTAKRELFSDA